MFQFMDFWLSFMAVISTFIYLATIDEVLKRAIHTAVAILTALMAATKATRYMNWYTVNLGTATQSLKVFKSFSYLSLLVSLDSSF